MRPVDTLQDAVDIAERFLKRYYASFKLLKAMREENKWVVEFDVGILNRQLVRILLNAETGDVIEYVSPDKP